MADPEFGAHGSLRVPPDALGKRLALRVREVVSYTSGTIVFGLGEEVIGGTSGAKGHITSVRGTQASGTIEVAISDDSPVVGFVAGEQLLVDSVLHALVDHVHQVYTPEHVLVGANNPINGQFVDRKGSAFIRFAEGDQQLDAFGLIRASSPQQIAFYTHPYDTDTTQWLDLAVGGGAISHLPFESAVALDVDSTSGAEARRTTHRHHIYQPGFASFVQTSVVCGDSGKAGVRRRWGYFGDDGLFFELDGTTLYVVCRSSTTGVVVDTRIAQTNWNGDWVDGDEGPSNLSGVSLDITTLNVYWIDFAWLGGGRARFGIYGPDGTRIVCHTFENSNAFSRPWMRFPNLPIRISIENTTATASPSRLKLVCAQVSVEGVITPERQRRTRKVAIECSGQSVSDASDDMVCAFRSKLTFNGIVNRKITIPEKLGIYVKTNPIKLTLWKRVTLTDPNWVSAHAEAAFEQDEEATAFTGGRPLVTWTLPVGATDLVLPSNFGILSENMTTSADGTEGNVFLFVARSLEPGSATVQVFSTWIDVG